MEKHLQPEPLHLQHGDPATPRNATETEVFLYDQIGFFGISAEQFVKDLRGINSATVALRINSPGGAVFEGVAMMNAIREHPARITAHIDGLAASIASGIAMAADEIVMAKGAFMMIHEPFGLVVGDAGSIDCGDYTSAQAWGNRHPSSSVAELASYNSRDL